MRGRLDSLMQKAERTAEDLSSEHEPPLATIPGVLIKFRQFDLGRPWIVSIGPYWPLFGRDDQFRMDDKLRLLKSFLGRNSEFRLEDYIEAVVTSQKEASQCYEQSIFSDRPLHIDLQRFFEENKPYNLDPMDNISLGDPRCFVVLLLLDGCFIIELFLKWLNEEPDILFTEYRIETIVSDLLLFDNQIPFVVIEKLFDLLVRGPNEISITAQSPALGAFILSHLGNFLMREKPGRHISQVTSWPKPIHHLLDFYHQFLIGTTSLSQDVRVNHDLNVVPRWKRRLMRNKWVVHEPPRHIPCAINLHQADIKIRRKKSPKTFLDVTFRRGILEIPSLEFDDNMRIIFDNLTALEREKNWTEQIVTSYIVLMDSLINTKADIDLLQRAGVIYNMLPTELAVNFFHQLNGGFLSDTVNHHFAKLFWKVQRYYDSGWWNRSWTRLICDYFNSLWTIISVIAGVILLLFTGLQTFYTVYPYYRPH